MVQQELLLDDRERFALIRGLRIDGLSRLELGRVRRVLEKIQVAIGCEQGRPAARRISDLADSLDWSEKTTRRWIRRAEDLGLIQVDRQTDSGGQQASTYSIDWERVRRPIPPQRAPGQNDQAPGQNDRAPSQNDQAPGQNDRAYKEQVQEQEPRINSSSITTRIEPHPELPDPWVVVVEELSQEGIADIQETIRTARDRGSTPERILAILAHFRSRPGAWDLGFLVWRLKHDRPDLDPSSTWPEPRDSPAAREVRRSRRELERAELAARQREARDRQARDIARRRDLEERHGAELDGLGGDARDRLAACLDRDAAEIYRTNPHWARAELLELLARQEAGTQTDPGETDDHWYRQTRENETQTAGQETSPAGASWCDRRHPAQDVSDRA